MDDPRVVWSDWDGEGGEVIHTIGAVVASTMYIGSMVVVGGVSVAYQALRWLSGRS